MNHNNFKELEDYKIKKFGAVPPKINDNIEKNKNLLTTISETMDLFTDKFIKTIIKINK
jgi:hypothetical protein